MIMIPISRIFGWAIAFLLVPSQFDCIRAEPGQPLIPAEISVAEDSPLPGFRAADLLPYLAAQMDTAKSGPWRFSPAAAPKPQDRVTWSFKTDPQAAGAVRNYGFSRAMMDRLVGPSRLVVHVEARLFLRGAYQGLVAADVDWHGTLQETELAQSISTLTRELMTAPGITSSD
jgi:hypothetical protein